MPTKVLKVLLEAKFMDNAEVIFRLNDRLLSVGLPDVYGTPAWLDENQKYLFTELGLQLRTQLDTLPGISFRYSQYSFSAYVPTAFDLVDALWKVLQLIALSVSDDVEFATSLGTEDLTDHKYFTNPDRHAFGQLIDQMLVEFCQHRSRDIQEAERTIVHLTESLEAAQRAS